MESKTLLEVKNAGIQFGGLKAVQNLNLKLNQGELVGLIGPNGAGKTTSFNLLTGVYVPTEGDILFNGERINGLAPFKVTRKGISRTFQNIRLFNELSVLDNVKVAYHSLATHTMLSSILRLPSHFKGEKEMEEKSLEFLKIFKLEKYKDELAKNLPYGQQRRLEIARALAAGPKLLLLDEPLSSIDASSRESLALIIKRIQRETKTTTIYVTHNQQEARLIADRVAIMYNGIIQQSGTMIDIDNNPKNFQIAHIMGQLNIWEVNSQKFEQGNLIISSPLGDITIASKEEKKITGIKIHPNKINLFNEDEEVKQKLYEQLLIISGKIITIIQLKSKIYQIIIQIDQNDVKKPFNYLKMQSQDQVLIKNLSINQNITLKIDPKDIILF